MSKLSLALILSILAVGSAVAQTASSDPASDPVLVKSGRATVTRSDFELELKRLPENMREGFTQNPARIEQLVNNIYVRKLMAKDALASGLDKDPVTARLVASQIERLWAQARLEKLDAEAAAEFDRNRDKYEARARELYAIEKDKTHTPEQVLASHILVKTEGRTDAEALKRAHEVRAMAREPGRDFNELALTTSDDPQAMKDKGRLPPLQRDSKGPVAEAALRLAGEGDISEPIKTAQGYEIVKLIARQPERTPTYEETRDRIFGELRQKYVEDARSEYFASLAKDPTLVVSNEELAKLRTHQDQQRIDEAVRAFEQRSQQRQ